MKKATREQSKSHNKTLILNLINQTENISRAEISRFTHLTRSTVSEIVAELIEEGLVIEAGFGKSAGGKPPRLLNLVKDARQIIGIDLASGEFRGALVNLRGEIQHRITIPIEDRSGEQALEFVFKLIDQLIKQAVQPILGIGIGAPGLMDSKNGIVITAVNLDWENLSLVKILINKYSLPVFIANDSQISALAEHKFGSSESPPNLLVVKIGRGVGSGIIINNQLYQGDGFGAGEIGHVKVEENGQLCRCGKYGCLETRISSRAIRKYVSQQATDNPDSALLQFNDVETITTQDIFESYLSGNPTVVDYIYEAGCLLGTALSFVTSTLNINKIVIAGSISVFGDGITCPALEKLQAATLPAISEQIEITASILGEEIVILGAAAMVLHHEMGIQ